MKQNTLWNKFAGPLAPRALRALLAAAVLAPQPSVFGMAVLESGHPSPVAAAPFITAASNLRSIAILARPRLTLCSNVQGSPKSATQGTRDRLRAIRPMRCAE